MKILQERQTHAHMELVDDPTRPTGKSPKITMPKDVVEIRSKEELQAQLKHYNKPFVSHVVGDSKAARLNYIERLRPALRYYCAKFGVAVPKWLANDDFYLKMTDSQKLHLFGTTELKVKEFKKLKFKRRVVQDGKA